MSFLTKISKKKTLQRLIGLLVLIVILFIGQTHIAFAGTCDIWDPFACIVQGMVWFTLLIVYAIGSLGFLVMALNATLLMFILKLSFTVLSNDIVRIGFQETLALANLGFVLAIILIAFATILRLEKYGIKKLLLNLIIAAVIVNFSLFIAGIFIDFSNIFTAYFLGLSKEAQLTAATNTGSSATSTVASGTNPNAGNEAFFTNGIVASFQPQKFLVPPDTASDLGDDWEKILPILTGASFATIFTWIMAFTIGAVAIMILIRYIYLIFLLILMPLAWAFWVIPTKSDLFSSWWKRFIEQIFFLPSAIFFVYLATTVASKYINAGTLSKTFKDGLNTQGSSTSILASFQGIIENAVNLFVIAGLLIGGLIAANKLGGKSAELGIGFAKGARSKFLSGSKAVGGKVSQVTGLTRVGKAATRGLSNIAQRLGFKGTANRLAGAGNRKEEIEKYQKDTYSKLTDEQLIASQKSASGQLARVSLVNESIKRNKLGDLFKGLKEDDVTKYATAIQKANPGKKAEDIAELQTIFKAMPQIAGKFAEKGKETEAIAKVAKNLDAKEAKRLSVDSLGNMTVGSELSDEGVKAIGQTGNKEKINALKASLTARQLGASLAVKEIKSLDDKLRKLKKQIEDAKGEGESKKDLVSSLQRDRNTAENRRKTNFATLNEGEINDYRAVKNLHTLTQTIAGSE